MANPVPITKEVALDAVRSDPRITKFHSLAGEGMVILGCDTERESIIEAIESADTDRETIGWTQDPFRPGHELIVVDGHGAVRWYDLMAPEGTFDD